MISYIKAVCFEGLKVIRDWLADKEIFLTRMYVYIKFTLIFWKVKHLSIYLSTPLSQGKGTLLEIFSIQVAEIILPLVADRFLSIGWVPMS